MDLDGRGMWFLMVVLPFGTIMMAFSYWAGYMLGSWTMFAFGVLLVMALVVLTTKIKRR